MTDLVMPKLGLTMTEGLLAEWKVAPGVATGGLPAAGIATAPVPVANRGHYPTYLEEHQ